MVENSNDAKKLPTGPNYGQSILFTKGTVGAILPTKNRLYLFNAFNVSTTLALFSTNISSYKFDSSSLLLRVLLN